MKKCTNCTHRIDASGNRIDCANTAASPRTNSYPGCGAHPLGFDPEIVINCEGWEADVADFRATIARLRATRPWGGRRGGARAVNPSFVGGSPAARRRVLAARGIVDDDEAAKKGAR